MPSKLERTIKMNQLPFRFDDKIQGQLKELQAAFEKEQERIRWNDKKPKYGIDFGWPYYSMSLNRTIVCAIKIAHKRVISKKDLKVISKAGSPE